TPSVASVAYNRLPLAGSKLAPADPRCTLIRQLPRHAAVNVVGPDDNLDRAAVTIRQRLQRLRHSRKRHTATVQLPAAIREQGRAAQVGSELQNIVALAGSILINIRRGCHQHRKWKLADEQLVGLASFHQLL